MSVLRFRLADSPERLVGAAPELEALPLVAHRVLSLLRDDRTSVGALASLLETDQALASAVLRHANSASSMPRRRIGTVREGIARVGQRALWAVVVQTCAGPMLDRGLPPYALSRRTAWRHAATTSAAARRLSSLLGLGHPDEAGVAGLLHDVGKMVLTSVVPELIAEAVSLARGQRLPVWQAERQVLGFDHAAVSGALLRSWGFPDPVVEAVEFHHGADPAERPLSALVYLSDIAAHVAGAVGGGGACPQPEWDMPTAVALGGVPEELEAFLSNLRCVEEGDLCA
jgi:putative nucleotidyltransferase with HDIG domain